MKQFGPYTVGDNIPEDALVGVNHLTHQLYTVVGEFFESATSVPGETERQDIDGFGVVLSEVYSGSPIEASVKIWSMFD